MRLAFFHRRQPTCWPDDSDVRMARLMLCADSLLLWRVVESDDTEAVVDALERWDRACLAYLQAITTAALEEDR